MEHEPPTPFPILDPSWLESAQADRVPDEAMDPFTLISLPGEFIRYVTQAPTVTPTSFQHDCKELVTIMEEDELNSAGLAFAIPVKFSERLALSMFFTNWVYGLW